MKFDIAIIGGGPGGYTAAEKAAKAGRSVVLFEKEDLGGTCLNRGCMPTKALLHSAETYAALGHAQDLGVQAQEIRYDFAAMHQRKDQVVATLRQGVEKLMKASKVTVGDSATIQTGYWGGSDLQGRLIGIRNDPTNPQTSRLLVFEVTGDSIESGTQVSVSIGQRSQNYDLIVPNSAVRSDANGSFVLMMTSKSSPLGTRYQATRVDVQVVASDDVNSAVTGAIVAYDYVITNSTAPIEDGMYVRLADNA